MQDQYILASLRHWGFAKHSCWPWRPAGSCRCCGLLRGHVRELQHRQGDRLPNRRDPAVGDQRVHALRHPRRWLACLRASHGSSERQEAVVLAVLKP